MGGGVPRVWDGTRVRGAAAVRRRTPGRGGANLSRSGVVGGVGRAFDGPGVRAAVGVVIGWGRVRAEGAVVGGEGWLVVGGGG